MQDRKALIQEPLYLSFTIYHIFIKEIKFQAKRILTLVDGTDMNKVR